MSKNCLLRLITLITFFCTLPLAAQNTPIPNWTVPANRHNAVTNTDLSNAAAFVAITPCRMVDTRNAPGAYGGPGFSPNETRSYPVPSGPCSGIPIAAAYSLNFTIVSYSAGTFLTAYTTGLPRPFVSTVNAGGGSPVANAAIVPASSNGSFDVYASGTTHIIIDINGYFPDSRANLNAGDQFALFGTVAGSAVIRGENFSTSSSVFTSGVRGVVDGATTNVAGVFGESTGAGANYGVKGLNDIGSNDSAGILGYSVARATVGSTTFYRAGVRGEVDNASNGIGIFGISSYLGAAGTLTNPSDGSVLAEGDLGYLNPTGPAAYGVFSFGNTGATGTKSFIEPHPSDASKVIRYVSLEGPEAGTYFRGRGRFVDHHAIIDVPENFRMVTEEDGLTVNITPMGGVASVGVISASLDQIVAESSRDTEFSFIVYGVRRGYKDFEPVANGNEFVPRNAEQKIPAYLNAQQKQRLIDNGTYNPDGSVNLRTAEKLGWTKMWAATATQQPHAVATDK